MPNFFTAAISRQSRRRSMGAAVNVKVAFAPELLGPLDNFRSKQGDISRAEAIRLLVRDGLLQTDAMLDDPSEVSSYAREFVQRAAA